MGTRNIIAIKNDDGVRSIYCQYDGYPEANGVRLSHSYTDSKKINALMDFGDIGDLANEINESRRIGNSKPGKQFEEGVERATGGEAHDSVKEMMGYWSNSDLEYLHLFDDGKWQIYQPGKFGENSGDITSWVRDRDAEKMVADIVSGKAEDKYRIMGERKSVGNGLGPAL